MCIGWHPFGHLLCLGSHPVWYSISGADSRLAPSQWETSLQSNSVSHWLGANLKSALDIHPLNAVVSIFMLSCQSNIRDEMSRVKWGSWMSGFVTNDVNEGGHEHERRRFVWSPKLRLSIVVSTGSWECHDANFVVADGTGVCRSDNLQNCQWRHIWKKRKL